MSQNKCARGGGGGPSIGGDPGGDRSRGGRGGRVPPSNFSGGDRPPLDF